MGFHRMVWDDPDDPYKTEITMEDGELRVVVTADAMGNSEEVKAECKRRVDYVIQRVKEMQDNLLGR